MVVFSMWRWPCLHRPSKRIAVHKQANDDIVHLRRFREADCLADEAFDARPERQMFPLDFLGVPLAWTMHFRIEMPGVGIVNLSADTRFPGIFLDIHVPKYKGLANR